MVKRYGFRGQKATHGTKDQERAPGSIGSTEPARVFPGMRMPGHMGDARVTIKNLEIVEVNSETNELFIKGAIPGSRGGLLLISADGDLKVNQAETDSSSDENTENDKSKVMPEEKIKPASSTVATEEKDEGKKEGQTEEKENKTEDKVEKEAEKSS